MQAPFWVTQTVEEFGKALGIEELAFGEKGVLQLEVEDLGTLTLELREEAVLVYLDKRSPHHDPQSLSRALQLCHHSQSLQPWIQAALLGEGRLAFAVRIANDEFQLAALEEAITALSNLHDAMAEGIPTPGADTLVEM